jgi:hypothetical protein
VASTNGLKVGCSWRELPTVSATLVQKLWNYCNVLRDDGMSYGDYVEQLTYLLFLKMADERSRRRTTRPVPVPAPYAWPALLPRTAMRCSTTTATRWKRWAGSRARWR